MHTLLVVLLSIPSVYAFLPLQYRRRAHYALTSNHFKRFRELQAINNTDTWSRASSFSSSSSPSPNESRFGVRRRVKKVLEKAKIRTGLKNYSETNSSTYGDKNDAAKVVADAVAIGGLVDDADFVLLNGEGSSSVSTPEALAVYSGENAFGRANSTSDLVLESRVTASSSNQIQQTRASPQGKIHVDSLLAAERTVDPLPFRLPTLTSEQRRRLAAGERIQEQSKMGREGSGFVVLDVKAPPYVVWECLLDFEAYPEYIGTVKRMTMFTNTHLSSSYLAEKPILPGFGRETRHYGVASISRASFVLSKFQLKIAAVHKYQPHPDGHYMIFTLDRANKNLVLKDAKGIWYTQANPDGLGEDITRVWLLCEVRVSSVLPGMIVDYVAERAMPRATNWIRPTVEIMKQKLLG